MNQATYREAERELSEYFTSALGVGAQSYDDAGGTELFDSDKALARFFVGPLPKAVRDHRAVEWTLEQLEPRHRTTLRLRYFPMRIGVGPYQTALGGLAALGLETGAALRGFAHWRELSPKRQATALIQWLDDEATRGGGHARREAIETEAAGRLSVALACYEVARTQRLRSEADARRARDAAARTEHLSALGGPATPAKSDRPSRVRIKAPKVRRELAAAVDVMRALAEHADLLAAADTIEEAR